MRLFTAFELPPEVKSDLARVQADLASLPFKRWQSLATLHLTLHFLGEVQPDRLEDLEKTLRDGCRGFGGFPLHLEGLGAFPSRQRPRTLWIGVGGRIDRLRELEKRLRPRVTDLGIPLEDREYRPHITLARDPRGPVQLPAPEEGRGLPDSGREWQATELVLFQSVLQRGGAVHTPLARFPLA